MDGQLDRNSITSSIRRAPTMPVEGFFLLFFSSFHLFTVLGVCCFGFRDARLMLTKRSGRTRPPKSGM